MTQKTPQNAPGLNAQNLMDEARSQTGLEDWGGDDFREGLDVLLSACGSQAGLSEFGRRKLAELCIHNLENRLRTQNLIDRLPEITETEVVRPMFLVTFPRSGSSLLHRLLCQEPSFRAPLFGEMWQPAPRVGEDPEAAERRARIHQAGERFLQPLEDLFPEGAAARGTMPAADEPGECWPLFEKSFTSFNYTFDYYVPDYLDWLCELDFRPAYSYYKRQLQVLQKQAPGGPWCMKCADHLLGIDALLETFPDADIVVIHRDPRKMVPSLGNLQVCHMNLWREEPMDAKLLGEYCLERYKRVVNQAASLQERVDPSRFYALEYEQLAADPVGEALRLMEYFNHPVHGHTAGFFQAYLDAHPKPKNRYSLGAYGLDRNEVDESLSVYLSYFESTQKSQPTTRPKIAETEASK